MGTPGARNAAFWGPGRPFRLNSYRGMTRSELFGLVKGAPGAKAALNLKAA